MLPFLAYGKGIFWIGNTAEPWIQLGINIGSLLAIIVWAAVHSFAIFGGLYYFNLLRIDKETEFLGCDITKHGESAYPVTAWKETQYDASITNLKTSIPSFMSHNEINTVSEVPESNSHRNKNSVENRQMNGVDNVAMDKIE